MPDIYLKYATFLSSIGIAFLQNDLLGFVDGERIIAREEELIKASPKEIRDFCITASYLIFGGIGYSGLNPVYNSNSGMYQTAINNRKDEIQQSKKIGSIYSKLKQTIDDLKLIVLTHMPKSDWSNEEYVPNWYYVSGHTHKSYYRCDKHANIFSDNQIGYFSENIKLKKFTISSMSNLFIDYIDGIHTISAKNYLTFYRLNGQDIQFNTKHDIIMIKKAEYYMFFVKNGDKVKLLDGGRSRTIEHDINYYYNRIELYVNNVNMFFEKYNTILKRVSSEINLFGGMGHIHGCIVDIDFFNHVYVNPFDGKIIPYYAESSIDKYIYNDVRSLLYHNCDELFLNYENIRNASQSDSLIYSNESTEITSGMYVADTEIYKISKIFKKFQFLSNNHIIRVWNDSLDNLNYNERTIPEIICMLEDSNYV